MLRAFRLAARTVLCAVACFTSPSKGAVEPWASNTDLTDVPRSHVQDVTTSPFTYNVTQGGTIDGKMCTTLPGVWEPYEQTCESNRSVRMENVGARNVINPWLRIGPVDSSRRRPSRTPLWRSIMLMRDNHTLANELDLVRDHDLIKRVHQYGIMSPMKGTRQVQGVRQ